MQLEYEIFLNGRPVSVSISDSALAHLGKKTNPLLLELELYFSCLIKKVCHFHETAEVDDAARVMGGLYVRFRATMTRKCAIGEFDKDQAADFPIVNQKPCIPKLVRVDYLNNMWTGEFGYAE